TAASGGWTICGSRKVALTVGKLSHERRDELKIRSRHNDHQATHSRGCAARCRRAIRQRNGDQTMKNKQDYRWTHILRIGRLLGVRSPARQLRKAEAAREAKHIGRGLYRVNLKRVRRNRRRGIGIYRANQKRGDRRVTL